MFSSGRKGPRPGGLKEKIRNTEHLLNLVGCHHRPFRPDVRGQPRPTHRAHYAARCRLLPQSTKSPRDSPLRGVHNRKCGNRGLEIML